MCRPTPTARPRGLGPTFLAMTSELLRALGGLLIGLPDPSAKSFTVSQSCSAGRRWRLQRVGSRIGAPGCQALTWRLRSPRVLVGGQDLGEVSRD